MGKKERKIIFSKEIDSIISGFSLCLTFIIIGIILLLYPDFFGNSTVTSVFRWIFIVFGALGLLVELPKLANNVNIKGINSMSTGAIFIFIVIGLMSFDLVVLNIISFFVGLIGFFGFFKGLFEFLYSVYLIAIAIKEKNKIGKVFASIVVFLTQLVGLALIVVQLMQALFN